MARSAQENRELIVDQILGQLDAGTVPWHKPWAEVGGQLKSDGKPYNGINQLITTMVAMANGYEGRRWVTFKQAKKLGGNVKRGEKSTVVALYKPIFVKDEEAEDGKRKILLLKAYRVFNVDQCEGVPDFPRPELADHDPIEDAQEAFDGYIEREVNLSVSHGGDSAHYVPSMDHIQLPVLGAFKTPDDYHGVAFHEAAHSTGHESRLNREGIQSVSFGSTTYSFEELVAELTAAMVSGEVGINPRIETSAGYIDHWRKKISEDKKIIMKAASEASKAADRILGREREVPEDSKEEDES